MAHVPLLPTGHYLRPTPAEIERERILATLQVKDREPVPHPDDERLARAMERIGRALERACTP